MRIYKEGEKIVLNGEGLEIPFTKDNPAITFEEPINNIGITGFMFTHNKKRNEK